MPTPPPVPGFDEDEHEPEDFDDGVVEDKQHAKITKSDYECLVAGLEFFTPETREWRQAHTQPEAGAHCA
mgnify:CR=1 FL=1